MSIACPGISSRVLLLLFGAVFCGVGSASAGQVPIAVSPGDSEELALVETRCPTFSWAAVEGAASYELAVYDLDELRGSAAEPVSERILSGGVTVWTPSGRRCLEKGGRYRWSVRAVGPKGPSEWSTAFFQVAAGPSDVELRQILEAVQRLVAAEAVGAGLRDGDDWPPPEEAAAAATRAAYPPGPGTNLLVEDGHIAVRRNGLGFVQLDTRANLSIPAFYCEDLNQTGRMLLRVGSLRRLYICVTDGESPSWTSISLP